MWRSTIPTKDAPNNAKRAVKISRVTNHEHVTMIRTTPEIQLLGLAERSNNMNIAASPNTNDNDEGFVYSPKALREKPPVR